MFLSWDFYGFIEMEGLIWITLKAKNLSAHNKIITHYFQKSLFYTVTCINHTYVKDLN